MSKILHIGDKYLQKKHKDRIKTDFVDKINALSRELDPFENMVEQTIDMKALQQHEYLINSDFSNELK